MQARPHTKASKKRILKRKKKLRGDNRPQLGIPPRGKGFVGKRAVGH